MALELNFHPAVEKTKQHPILFVHGMAHGAWAWEENFVPYFNLQGYDCYALSLRGHGNSTGKENLRWSSIKDYGQDFEWTLSQIKQKPICFGHSMGGFIIQKYLLKHDNLPAMIGVASVPHTGMWRGALNLLRKYPWQFLVANLRLDTIPFSSSFEIVKAMCLTPQADDELVRSIQSRLQSESYRAFLDLVLLNHHRAQKLKTPLLFLHSKVDVVLFENEMKNSAEEFGADFFTLEDVGHDMMLDANWKKAATRISNWLIEKQL